VLDLAMRVEREAEARFSARLAELGKSVTIAVMGCEVNGPGEACHADLGVAGGRGGSMLLFSRGRKIRKISVGEAVEAIAREIETLLRRG
jgi:(E)-4-hydroxy-3-methylbut-2-enyl-diphosphate synthase